MIINNKKNNKNGQHQHITNEHPVRLSPPLWGGGGGGVVLLFLLPPASAGGGGRGRPTPSHPTYCRKSDCM